MAPTAKPHTATAQIMRAIVSSRSADGGPTLTARAELSHAVRRKYDAIPPAWLPAETAAEIAPSQARKNLQIQRIFNALFSMPQFLTRAYPVSMVRAALRGVALPRAPQCA